MAQAWRDWLSAREDYRSEVDDCRELDGERVLVLTHWSARGKTSGLEAGQIRTKGVVLSQVRDGKVTRMVVYFDRDHALADLGFTVRGWLFALVVRCRLARNASACATLL
jgi:hypothetical protein